MTTNPNCTDLGSKVVENESQRHCPCPALPWVAPQDSSTSWPCLAASGRGVSLLKWSLSNCFSDCVSCYEEKTEKLRSTWVAGGPFGVWSWTIPLIYCLILVLGRQDPSGPRFGNCFHSGMSCFRISTLMCVTF